MDCRLSAGVKVRRRADCRAQEIGGSGRTSRAGYHSSRRRRFGTCRRLRPLRHSGEDLLERAAVVVDPPSELERGNGCSNRVPDRCGDPCSSAALRATIPFVGESVAAMPAEADLIIDVQARLTSHRRRMPTWEPSCRPDLGIVSGRRGRVALSVDRADRSALVPRCHVSPHRRSAVRGLHDACRS